MYITYSENESAKMGDQWYRNFKSRDSLYCQQLFLGHGERQSVNSENS